MILSKLIKNSIDFCIVKYSTISQKIYRVLLVAVVAAFVLLLFIYIKVLVQESKVIRPIAEK